MAKVAAPKAADDRPAQGGGLLAPLAQGQGHRHHAGEHGEAGHQDRPKPALGARRPPPLADMPVPAAALGKRQEQDGVGGRDADGHDRAHERLDVQGRPGQRQGAGHPGDHRRDRRGRDQRQPERLEISRQQQDDDDHRQGQADGQAAKHLLHRHRLAADVDLHAAGRLAGRLQRPLHAADHPAEVLALDVGGDASPAAACCSGHIRPAWSLREPRPRRGPEACPPSLPWMGTMPISAGEFIR